MLDNDQRKEIEDIIAAHESTRRLSSGQKWDVSVIFGAFVGGAIAILGVGGFFVVENAASVRAGQIAARDVASSLLDGQELVALVSEATTTAPIGAVVAFERSDGCPAGWIDYASGRGRVIIGATPPDRESGPLTRREFQRTGGTETHTIMADQIPDHSHTTQNIKIASLDFENQPHNQVPPSDSGFRFFRSGTNQNSVNTGGIASGRESQAPIPIIQPYIALYFCKKT